MMRMRVLAAALIAAGLVVGGGGAAWGQTAGAGGGQTVARAPTINTSSHAVPALEEVSWTSVSYSEYHLAAEEFPGGAHFWPNFGQITEVGPWRVRAMVLRATARSSRLRQPLPVGFGRLRSAAAGAPVGLADYSVIEPNTGPPRWEPLFVLLATRGPLSRVSLIEEPRPAQPLRPDDGRRDLTSFFLNLGSNERAAIAFNPSIAPVAHLIICLRSDAACKNDRASAERLIHRHHQLLETQKAAGHQQVQPATSAAPASDGRSAAAPLEPTTQPAQEESVAAPATPPAPEVPMVPTQTPAGPGEGRRRPGEITIFGANGDRVSGWLARFEPDCDARRAPLESDADRASATITPSGPFPLIRSPDIQNNLDRQACLVVGRRNLSHELCVAGVKPVEGYRVTERHLERADTCAALTATVQVVFRRVTAAQLLNTAAEDSLPGMARDVALAELLTYLPGEPRLMGTRIDTVTPPGAARPAGQRPPPAGSPPPPVPQPSPVPTVTLRVDQRNTLRDLVRGNDQARLDLIARELALDRNAAFRPIHARWEEPDRVVITMAEQFVALSALRFLARQPNGSDADRCRVSLVLDNTTRITRGEQNQSARTAVAGRSESVALESVRNNNRLEFVLPRGSSAHRELLIWPGLGRDSAHPRAALRFEDPCTAAGPNIPLRSQAFSGGGWMLVVTQLQPALLAIATPASRASEDVPSERQDEFWRGFTRLVDEVNRARNWGRAVLAVQTLAPDAREDGRPVGNLIIRAREQMGDRLFANEAEQTASRDEMRRALGSLEHEGRAPLTVQRMDQRHVERMLRWISGADGTLLPAAIPARSVILLAAPLLDIGPDYPACRRLLEVEGVREQLHSWLSESRTSLLLLDMSMDAARSWAAATRGGAPNRMEPVLGTDRGVWRCNLPSDSLVQSFSISDERLGDPRRAADLFRRLADSMRPFIPPMQETGR